MADNDSQWFDSQMVRFTDGPTGRQSQQSMSRWIQDGLVGMNKHVECPPSPQKRSIWWKLRLGIVLRTARVLRVPIDVNGRYFGYQNRASSKVNDFRALNQILVKD